MNCIYTDTIYYPYSVNYCYLHYACQSNRHAKLLLQYGADVGRVGNFNQTPLHSACGNNNMECAKLLLDHGCPAGEPAC